MTVTMFCPTWSPVAPVPVLFRPEATDNYDSTATEGYFDGLSTMPRSASLMFRRVSNPGSRVTDHFPASHFGDGFRGRRFRNRVRTRR